MRRIGLLLAMAALLVSAPRLALVFIQADGLAVPAQARAALLALTGVFAACVLTGGGMFIAHVLAQHGTRRGLARGLLALVWLLLLAFATVLIAPAMVVGIRSTALAGVLDPLMQWVWATAAVLSIEVLAAGAMVAHVLTAEPVAQAPERRRSGTHAVDVLAGALARRITANLEPVQAMAMPVQMQTHEPAREPAQSDSPAGIVRKVACPQGCGFVGSQSGVNAHQRFCPRRNGRVAELAVGESR